MAKNIDFIIPTFDRYNKLKVILNSLMVQTAGNWKATVVIDNNADEKMVDIVKSFNDERVRYILTGKRYNDWGHSPRQLGKQESDCDYVIMTGDDNYYMPILVEEINKLADDDPDFIYWDMVHSHYEYHYFQCYPYFNQIDMGAFAFRATLGKQVQLFTTYAADGIFVNTFKETFPECKMKKINKVLFVHN